MKTPTQWALISVLWVLFAPIGLAALAGLLLCLSPLLLFVVPLTVHYAIRHKRAFESGNHPKPEPPPVHHNCRCAAVHDDRLEKYAKESPGDLPGAFVRSGPHR